jgi:hypothetical protein
MALPNIILDAPQLLVTASDSPRGYNPYGKTTFIYGYVQAIYAGCINTIVGDYVFFDTTKVPAIIFGSTVYYIVPENQKAFKEPIVL